MENTQAQFQMLDNYVKEYSLKVDRKLTEEMDITMDGHVEFRIINISEKDDILIGEIELSNNIDLVFKNEIVGKIYIVMGGLFKYNNKEDSKKFENMLKINGAATLSHFIRTYIHSNSVLSGMPSIITPMINFVDFFKDENK